MSSFLNRRTIGGIILISGILVLVGGLFIYRAWINSPIPLEKTVTLEIERGMTAREIGHLLAEREVINSVPEFRWAVWFKRAERDLRLGTVRINPGMTMDQLVESLREKSPLIERVQIPEGWPTWKIFDRLSNRLQIPRTQFTQLFDQESFLREQNIPSKTLEGFLFPDTYYFSLDAPARQVLARMIQRFHRISERLELVKKAQNVSLNLQKAVTLASIIQREGFVPEEAPLISGVYHNRLQRGMLLQADPTLLYELRNFDHPIYQSTLRRESPYNTYRNHGLPPTPICNPGRKSLEASVNPADIPYLYFVSRGNGRHVFSETLQEHQHAVRKFQR